MINIIGHQHHLIFGMAVFYFGRIPGELQLAAVLFLQWMFADKGREP
jgi:hypothetical protein